MRIVILCVLFFASIEVFAVDLRDISLKPAKECIGAVPINKELGLAKYVKWVDWDSISRDQYVARMSQSGRGKYDVAPFSTAPLTWGDFNGDGLCDFVAYGVAPPDLDLGKGARSKAISLFFLADSHGFHQVVVDGFAHQVTLIYVKGRDVPYLMISRFPVRYDPPDVPSGHVSVAVWVKAINGFVVTDRNTCNPIANDELRSPIGTISKNKIIPSKQVVKQICSDLPVVFKFADMKIKKPVNPAPDFLW